MTPQKNENDDSWELDNLKWKLNRLEHRLSKESMDKVFVTKHGTTKYNSMYIVIHNQQRTKVGIVLINKGVEKEAKEKYPIGKNVTKEITWDECWFVHDINTRTGWNRGTWSQREIDDAIMTAFDGDVDAFKAWNQ